MAERFRNKVALVTGGASGLGLAVVDALLAEGATVVAADIAEQPVDWPLSGGRSLYRRVDVSRSDEVKGLIDWTVKECGGLDLAFNNAGVLGSPLARTVECSEENWDHVVGVNLRGMWLCLKHELRKMRKAGKGAIVNTASAAAMTGSFVSLPYVVSKQAILGMTRFAAAEYAPRGIRVNAICPGYIRTPMLENLLKAAPDQEARLVDEEPIGRLGTPADVTGGVLWLLSDEASFVVGHALVVDGGMAAR